MWLQLLVIWFEGKKLCHICFFFFSFFFYYFFFFFFIPLPHLQWLCYQGSQAKGWSNHNFRAGLGRNNEVTKLQLPWQRHIQEHRMPLLKKIEETGPRIFPLSLSPPSVCLFFHTPPFPSFSLSPILSLSSLLFFLLLFFRQWGAEGSSSLSLPLFSRAFCFRTYSE